MINQERKIGFSILGIALLLVFVYIVSLAAFNFSQKGIRENKIQSGTVSMNYLEDDAGISITNAYPISDDTGKKLTGEESDLGIMELSKAYFDFTVSVTASADTTIQYEILGENISTEPSLGEEFVKIYLTDGDESETPMKGFDEEKVPTFSTFKPVSSNSKQRILYKGTFTKAEESQKFRLRMWVADTYEGEEQQTGFKLKIGVQAEQEAN